MIGDWLTFVVVAVAAVAVIFLPGAAVGAALRMRGLALTAFAPVATTAMVGIFAVLFEKIHISWWWLPFVVGVAIVAFIAWILRRRLAILDGDVPSTSSLLVPLGISVGAVLIGIRLLMYLGAPDAISQTNDAVFHLNALRYILETQSASSFTVSGVLGASSFYPAAWHGLVTLVIGVTAAGIPMAVNTVSLVIACLVWPLGIAWLTMVTTKSRGTAAVAGVLSGAMIHFPMLMLQWGVLYPNELSIALVPAALTVVLRRPSGIGSESVVQVWASRVLFGLVSMTALGFAQPVAVLTWMMLLVCHLFVRFALQGYARRGVRIVWGAGVVLGLALAWYAISRSSGGSHWGPYGNWLQAVKELVLTAQVELPAMPVITVLVILGLVFAVRARHALWLVFAWVGLSVLMIIATSVANPLIRDLLLGPWYADQYRIAATLPLVYVPLMAIGVHAAVTRIAARTSVAADGVAVQRLALVVATATGAGLLALAPVVQMPLITEGIKDQDTRYTIDDHTYLSLDERALIMRLPELVPADATIIGNPSTGMGFTFALSGIDAIPKTWSAPGGADWDLVAERLRDVSVAPAVCRALKSFDDAGYVLDFGIGETTAGRYRLPGMTDFEGQPGFALVARQGDASLWRITACR